MVVFGAHSPFRIAGQAAAVAGTRPRRVRMRAAAWMLPAQRRVVPGRSRRVTVELPGGGAGSFLVNHETDLLVLADVFGEGQYAHPDLENPRVIIDAGSHIGASVAYFAARYPNARVIGLEASPSTFKRLVKNTAGFPNVEVRHLALADRDGLETFFESPAGWESSLLDRGSGSEVRVPVRSLASLLDELNIAYVDLLKLDIEGAEHAVLQHFAPTPETVGAIVGEIHDWIPGATFTDEEFFALLGDYTVTTDRSGRDYVFRAVGA